MYSLRRTCWKRTRVCVCVKEKNVDHAGQKNDGGCCCCWRERKNVARGRAHSNRIHTHTHPTTTTPPPSECSAGGKRARPFSLGSAAPWWWCPYSHRHGLSVSSTVRAECRAVCTREHDSFILFVWFLCCWYSPNNNNKTNVYFLFVCVNVSLLFSCDTTTSLCLSPSKTKQRITLTLSTQNCDIKDL